MGNESIGEGPVRTVWLEPEASARRRIRDAASEPGVRVIVIVAGDSDDVAWLRGIGSLQPPTAALPTVRARLEPVTDAVKRVDGDRVVETVDRSRLHAVAFPILIPAALGARLDTEGAPTAAALLSELAAIDPDLRVESIDPHHVVTGQAAGESHG